jgi:hypothetical protein
MKIFGVVLVVIGALMLAYQGITYNTTRTLAQVGSVKLESHEKKTVPLPPIIGGLTLAGGIILLVAGRGTGS